MRRFPVSRLRTPTARDLKSAMHEISELRFALETTILALNGVILDTMQMDATLTQTLDILDDQDILTLVREPENPAPSAPKLTVIQGSLH